MTTAATDWGDGPAAPDRNPKWKRRAELYKNTLDELDGVQLPAYGGGTPAVINQMMWQAKNNGDLESLTDLRALKKKLFRNHRDPTERIVFEAKARKKFLDKYGARGQIALNFDDNRRRIAKMSQIEQSEYLAKILHDLKNPPPPEDAQ